MKHHVFGKKLGRSRNQRQALIKSLVSAFITHGKIETTHAKAKMVQPIIEKLGRAGSSRSSGFTRLIKTKVRRGDSARLSRLEWVDSKL